MSGSHYSVFFGSLGSTFAMSMTALGSSLGYVFCGVMISSMGVERPELVMKSLVPIVMASVVSIYGLIASLIIAKSVNVDVGGVSALQGFKALAGGISVGVTGIGAGYALGKIGQYGVLTYSKQPRFFVGMLLILIFAEVLGLYGLIVSLVLLLSK